VQAYAAAIGGDPGKDGAISLYWGEGQVLTHAFQSDETKTRGSKTNYIAAATVIRDWKAIYGDLVAYIEDVHAMPKQGVSSTFKFGYNAGAIYGICVALEIPTFLVSPNVWKLRLGLNSTARKSIDRACELFPFNKKDFFGPRGGLIDGVAEAALISWYGWHNEQGDLEFELDKLKKKHSKVI
jgi:crossover junction endodeoxyribonuclease RuvC